MKFVQNILPSYITMGIIYIYIYIYVIFTDLQFEIIRDREFCEVTSLSAAVTSPTQRHGPGIVTDVTQAMGTGARGPDSGLVLPFQYNGVVSSIR